MMQNTIEAVVVCDSISESGVRLTSMLVDYPRIVHAEQLKHRMFSVSAASSRAIPFAKMADQLTGIPVSFGKNQSGMQAGEEHNELICGLYTAEEWWKLAKLEAISFAKGFSDAGYHKQVSNRLSEPFQTIRVLVTATEWDNFWWLRNDKAADPTLHKTASVMKEAYDASKPELLKAGEWHLPFVSWVRDSVTGKQNPYIRNEDLSIVELTVDDAITVSCARCAAQSFRNTDYDLEKSKQVYDRLVNGDKIHAGALEHVGTPMQAMQYMDETVNLNTTPWSWEQGVSHADRDGNLWSGNMKSWVQHRKLVAGECYKEH